MTCWLKYRFLPLLVVGALLLAPPCAVAEPATTTSDSTSSSSSSGGGDTAPGTAMYVPAPPPPPPPPEDRKDGQKAAKALGIVGAALAGASCIMLMAAAAREPDPSKRRQLMAQALAQCGQAAMSAASAAQNSDGEKKLTTNDAPKEGTIQMSGGKPAAPAEKKEAAPQLAQAAPEETFEMPAVETPTETESGVAPPTAFEPPPAAAPEETKIVAEAEAITTLDPIPDAKLGYDDNAKPGGTTPQIPGGGSQLSQSMSSFTAKTSIEELKKLDGTTSELTVERTGRGAKRPSKGQEGFGEGDGVGSGGKNAGVGSGGGGSGDAPDPFGDMLAQILGGGGGGGGETSGGGGGSGNVFVRDGDGSGEDGELPNIFQYAAFRYRKAAYDEKRVKKVPGKQAARDVSIGSRIAAAATKP